MKVLFYEIGYDSPNVLGSGTDYIVNYRTNDEKDAFNHFNQRGMTFMRRLVRDGSHLRHEFYNRFTGLWE
jgi:hypothetical protein